MSVKVDGKDAAADVKVGEGKFGLLPHGAADFANVFVLKKE